MALPKLEDRCREAVGAASTQLVDTLAEDAEPFGDLGRADEVGGVEGFRHEGNLGGGTETPGH